MRWLIPVVVLATLVATLLGAVDAISPTFADHASQPQTP